MNLRIGFLAALLVLAAPGGPPALEAADSAPAAETFNPAPLPEEERRLLEEVYGSPDFGTEENYRRIQFKEKERPGESRAPNKTFSFPALREILALALRLAAGAAALGGLAAGAVYLYRRRSGWGRLFPRTGQRGLPHGAGPKPLALLEEAAALHRSGKIREAWARCFRAFCAAFEEVRLLSLPPEATEYETLALVRGGAPAPAFETFVRRWVRLAYGGISPGAGTFEEALASCRTLLLADSGPAGSGPEEA
jgi:hypothetical protein